MATFVWVDSRCVGNEANTRYGYCRAELLLGAFFKEACPRVGHLISVFLTHSRGLGTVSSRCASRKTHELFADRLDQVLHVFLVKWLTNTVAWLVWLRQPPHLNKQVLWSGLSWSFLLQKQWPRPCLNLVVACRRESDIPFHRQPLCPYNYSIQRQCLFGDLLTEGSKSMDWIR